MTPFEWLEPTSFEEAVHLLDRGDEDARAVAGGTALMLMMKAGAFAPSKLINLQGIESHHAAHSTSDGQLSIGPLATLSSLEHSPAVRQSHPLIVSAMKRLSNPRVRNVACVGGALAHGDPHMDLPPILAMLGAKAVLSGPRNERAVPVDELYVGYYETVIAQNELVKQVIVPPMRGRYATYVKVTNRTVDDWPALGIAVGFDLVDGTISDARVVVGAATPLVTRLPATEAHLQGMSPTDDEALRAAGETAAGEAPVAGNARGSAGYKRELLRVFVKRAIRQALAEGSPG